MSTPLIECRNLVTGYGDLAVVHGLDLHVNAGEVVALIGANGAGKSTTLLTLAGEVAQMSGDVLWKGEATKAPMHVRCKNGMGYVTEERSVIMNLTTQENLRLANVSVSVAVDLFPALSVLLDRKAGLLSGGEQQMLSLARALGRRPEVLLLDELSLGLAPLIVTRLLETVRRAADTDGVGVLLVEQHVRQALKIADRVYVLERGNIALTGTSSEVRGRLEEIEVAYLSSNG
ncbi:MAG: High-affinity branched-chain amino acid transport ATP-binding protein LivF [Nitrosomonadaceae bacterium]|nr:High-affinity branched-chain amino acid transport ATP-binding protein LivF [Nitrosomonadaceae bacterium]